MIFSGEVPSIAVSRARPWLSVVVPAFNEEQLIGRTLGAIRAGLELNRGALAGYEIIVCDNNSTDRTAELAEGEGAVVVFEPVNQIGRARNSGAKVARGDWLLFVDADSLPPSGLIADTLAAIGSGRCVGGSATVQFDASPLWWRAVWAFKNQLARTIKIAFGAYIFCRRDAFEALGGFSTRLYAIEDAEFVNRLKRYGQERGLGFVVLDRYPILTSARKARQPFGRLLKTTVWIALTPYTGVHEPSRFSVWYDSRR